MSFLEYVAEQLMGPSVYGSCWHCPFCDSSGPSFSIRPPKPGYEVKFKCHRCDAWGDEFDLLKEFYPDEDYGQRQIRGHQLRRGYDQEDLFIHRGSGKGMFQVVLIDEDSGAVDVDWAVVIADILISSCRSQERRATKCRSAPRPVSDDESESSERKTKNKKW